MSSYQDPFPWYEPTRHRTDTKPPAPQLVEGERAPRVIYGPQGQVIAEVGVPARVPFGPQPSSSSDRDSLGRPEQPAPSWPEAMP